MPLNDTQWSRNDIERLMNFSAMSMELTGSIESCRGIPERLARTLGLSPVSLAIIEQNPAKTEPSLLCLAASGTIATGEGAANFQSHVLDIFRQTRLSAVRDGAAMRHSSDVSDNNRSLAQTNCPDPLYPRQLVLTRTLTSTTRLMIVVHLRTDQMLPSGIITESLALVVDQLAKLIRANLAWQESPSALGKQFDRLTEREWGVLLGMKSDDGEKQLADKLGLSPHTLHSHIKAIYRKVNVQGRLPLLLKLDAGIREMRLASIENDSTADNSDHAVAS